MAARGMGNDALEAVVNVDVSSDPAPTPTALAAGRTGGESSTEPLPPPMRVLQRLGGRKEKIRPRDALGALTNDRGFATSAIGKIRVKRFSSYVAVKRDIAERVTQWLDTCRVKGRSV